MMPHWEDVSSRITNMEISPTGKRMLVEARGEIFTIPAEKGDVRNLTNSSGAAERDRHGRPTAISISLFQRPIRRVQASTSKPQDGLTPAREITLPNPTHYYTASWSPDSKKLLFTDTNLKVWVIDTPTARQRWSATTRGWCRRAREPDMESRFKMGRVRRPPEIAVPRDLCQQCRDRRNTNRSPTGWRTAVWPAWDASGKYLWFLASTDFGLNRSGYDYDVVRPRRKFWPVHGRVKKGSRARCYPRAMKTRAFGHGRLRYQRRGPRPWRRTATLRRRHQAETPAPAARNVPDRSIGADRFRRFDSSGSSVPGVPERQYSSLRRVETGTCFILRPDRPRRTKAPGGAGGTILFVTDSATAKPRPFVNNVATRIY